MNLIFLAAAIPPKDKFGPTDRIAVRDSVLALVSQLEPEDELCFGGHPAITPFVITAAKSLNVLKQITIYQAHWFFEEVPPLHYEIARFIWDDRKKWPPGTRPSVETPDGVRERNESLKAMRIKMLSDIDFCIHPHQPWLASCSFDRTIRIWDVTKRTEICTLEGHTDNVRSVTFSHDGRLLASSSNDGTVRIWRTADWETVCILNEPTSFFWPCGIAFAPHDARLATFGDNDRTIRLWRVDIHRTKIIERT